jgi:hypothetical protein
MFYVFLVIYELKLLEYVTLNWIYDATLIVTLFLGLIEFFQNLRYGIKIS